MTKSHYGNEASAARRPITLAMVALVDGVIVPALLVLDSLGLVGDIEVWATAVMVVATTLAIYLAHRVWPANASPWGVHMRTAIGVLAVATVIYSTGWGPTLIFAFTVLFAVGIREFGSRIALPVTGWLLIATLGGQLAIALDFVPTVISEPEVHGLAVIAVIGTILSFGFFADVARLQEKAEVEVRRSEERFRSLVQNTSDVIAIVDADGKIRYLSPAVEEVLGFRPYELVDTLASELLDPDDMARAADLQMEASENPGRMFTAQLRVKHRDGDTRWVEAKISNRLDDPSVNGVVVNYRDIEERKKFEEQLKELAYFDALTGLPNRVQFLDRTEQALARAKRHGTWISLLFCDLDEFKVVNDTHGHQTGDGLLSRVAERLRVCTRAEDSVARLGGDEFTVLLEDLHYPQDTLMVAERILDSCASPFVIDGTPLRISVSIGMATSQGGDVPGELIERADQAMYEAKRKGKNRLETTGIDATSFVSPPTPAVAEQPTPETAS